MRLPKGEYYHIHGSLEADNPEDDWASHIAEANTQGQGYEIIELAVKNVAQLEAINVYNHRCQGQAR